MGTERICEKVYSQGHRTHPSVIARQLPRIQHSTNYNSSWISAKVQYGTAKTDTKHDFRTRFTQPSRAKILPAAPVKFKDHGNCFLKTQNWLNINYN